MSVDLERLRRGVHLEVEREPDGSAVVNGYRVTAEGCECPDFQVRVTWCKHRIARSLSVLEPELLEALRALLPLPPPPRSTRAGREPWGV